jgi:hypothetical protein
MVDINQTPGQPTAAEVANELLQEGQLFVVVRGPIQQRIVGGGGFSLSGSSLVKLVDQSYDGHVLRVLARCGPMVVAEVVFSNGFLGEQKRLRVSLDLRTLEVQPVTEVYLESLIGDAAS